MITLFITNNQKEHFTSVLTPEEIKAANFEVVERMKVSEIAVRLKVFSDKMKTHYNVFLMKLKSLFKHENHGPMVGGGAYDYAFVYALGQYIATFIISNVSWDITKIIFKKVYNSLKTKRRGYIAILSDLRAPFDTRLKFLIPNDLEDQHLEWALEGASKVYAALDSVRGYFGYDYVIVKFDN